MESRLFLEIDRQPDDTTCGPTCLQSVYRYFSDEVALDQIVREVPALPSGGTLAVLLANHALRRGYKARIHTVNLQVFDPTWFGPNGESLDLVSRLRAQQKVKLDPKLQIETDALVKFLDLGGEIRLDDISPQLIRNTLKRDLPILTGLSSNFLYRSMRERPEDEEDDDVGGEPAGHFVVLCGYDPTTKRVLVADPYLDNPFADDHRYEVSMQRLLNAILLGVLTFDGNLLVVEPSTRAATREPNR